MASPSARSFQEGLAAAHAGETERALEIARAMLARDARDVHAYQIMGFAQFTRGRNHEAFEAFAEANRLAPNQPAIINWLGVILKERGDFAKAREAFTRAVRLSPGNAEFSCNLAETLSIFGENDEARMAYERAAALNPQNALVLAKTARFFERRHDIARARRFAQQALEADPGNEIAQIAMAEVETRERKFEAVISRLEHTEPSDSANLRNLSKMRHLLAEAYDKTGRFDEAFAAYAGANDIQKDLFGDIAARERSPLSPEKLKAITAFFRNEDPGAWSSFEDLAEPAPVFLLGFVRSGTTWLDQILSSHPDIVVMEEEDNLYDAWSEYLLDTNGMEKLAALSKDEIDHFRRAYWKRVGVNLREKKRGKLYVDKVPLNAVQLGLIYRLFPEAKIIFCMRDPRDCVLSAFQQHFAINAALYQFLTLEGAAAYYDQVMTLAEIFRQKLLLDIHEIRYEDLVGDFEPEVRRLIDFLGVHWSDSLLAYYETARKRTILTASRHQVINKPYSTSIGKWRNYEPHMRAVLPTLDKWAEKFGYSVNAV